MAMPEQGNKFNKLENAFNEATDWFHFLLGLLSAIFLCLERPWIYLSILITLAFLFYEARQKESSYVSYSDFVEFIIGFVFGLITAKTLLPGFLL